MAVAESLQPAGAARGEDFRCTSCGYGAVFHDERPACPMCQADAWLPVGRSEPAVDADGRSEEA
jgi:hypothetical protein